MPFAVAKSTVTVSTEGFESDSLNTKALSPASPSASCNVADATETKGLKSLSSIVITVVGPVNKAPPVGALRLRLNVSLPASKRLSLMIGTLMILDNSPGPNVKSPETEV